MYVQARLVVPEPLVIHSGARSRLSPQMAEPCKERIECCGCPHRSAFSCSAPDTLDMSHVTGARYYCYINHQI